MDKVFHIRTFSSPNGACQEVELDLPATDYELLDAMEQIRLEDGKHQKMSSQAVPEDAAAARAAIAEALAGRGECGLRQLQAAMESEDCASLEEAVEIAGRLDSYEFVEIGSFREKAEKELLEKGLDKKVIDLCVDFTAYAALTHEFESI